MDIDSDHVSGGSSGSIDPAIFQNVQAQIDQDTEVRDDIRKFLKDLERHGRSITSVLSRAHAVKSSAIPALLQSAQPTFVEQKDTIQQLAVVASKYPYYKYCNLWSRYLQDASFHVVLAGWLGAFSETSGSQYSKSKEGRLMTIDEVGEVLGVPTNVKERDVFHLTLEEYLQSLISLIEELSRLAVNSVTLGDYDRPMLISRFVKDVHAGFQLLNLKNDSLRRRSDSIKYNVKKIEDVVYDLSLRKLVNPANSTETDLFSAGKITDG